METDSLLDFNRYMLNNLFGWGNLEGWRERGRMLSKQVLGLEWNLKDYLNVASIVTILPEEFDRLAGYHLER